MIIEDRDELFDESYFETPTKREGIFDVSLLRQPVGSLPVRRAVTVSPNTTVTLAMRAMQYEHRGCVIVTDDGTHNSKLPGIFTERDVLFRIVDRWRTPASLPIGYVTATDLETRSAPSAIG